MSLPFEIYYIALTKISGVGPVLAKTIVSYCGSVEAIFCESVKNLSKIPGIGPITANAIKQKDVLNIAEYEYQKALEHNIELLLYLKDSYPARLKHFPDSPILLYKKGQANLDHLRTVAIVGTRACSTYGKLSTESLVQDLKEYKVMTISGLAHGIDTLAHKESLRCKIPTVGVMGGGFEKIYPAANRNLAQKMMEEGAIISEFSFHEVPDREHFPMRNRIIAALSDAIIVVESASKGGSMITADFGNQYNKDVFAIPGKTTDQKSQGCNQLIKINKAALAESAKDIAYIMGWEKEMTTGQMQLPLETFNMEEQKIVDILHAEGEVHFDKIHYQTGINLSSLSQVLLGLEFKGIVKSIPGKCYLLNKHVYQP